MPIILGASGEFVLGMHGSVEFDGERLAGMYPHEQVKMAAAAGADIVGVAVNTNTNESVAWNLARAVTFVKAATAESNIPVHVNVGMGVGGGSNDGGAPHRQRLQGIQNHGTAGEGGWIVEWRR